MTNPRRLVLRHLRRMSEWQRTMTAVWDQPQSTRVKTEHHGNPGAHPSWTTRKLRPEEKVENQADQWIQLADYMQALAGQAREIEQFARQQAAQLSAQRG